MITNCIFKEEKMAFPISQSLMLFMAIAMIFAKIIHNIKQLASICADLSVILSKWLGLLVNWI